MKSYLQGLITGAVFVFALMVLIGASDNDNEVGRYAISSVTTAQFGRWEVLESIIETKTGVVVKRLKISDKLFEEIKI
jgi:hypothetical protein